MLTPIFPLCFAKIKVRLREGTGEGDQSESQNRSVVRNEK